jgi:hypothetical protein
MISISGFVTKTTIGNGFSLAVFLREPPVKLHGKWKWFSTNGSWVEAFFNWKLPIKKIQRQHKAFFVLVHWLFFEGKSQWGTWIGLRDRTHQQCYSTTGDWTNWADAWSSTPPHRVPTRNHGNTATTTHDLLVFNYQMHGRPIAVVRADWPPSVFHRVLSIDDGRERVALG